MIYAVAIPLIGIGAVLSRTFLQISFVMLAVVSVLLTAFGE
jgi:hypothetical protein